MGLSILKILFEILHYLFFAFVAAEDVPTGDSLVFVANKSTPTAPSLNIKTEMFYMLHKLTGNNIKLTAFFPLISDQQKWTRYKNDNYLSISPLTHEDWQAGKSSVAMEVFNLASLLLVQKQINK